MARHGSDRSDRCVQNAAAVTDVDDFIVDAYTEALLAARRQRRLIGEAARHHACIVAAAHVSAATGLAITAEMVAGLTRPWW